MKPSKQIPAAKTSFTFNEFCHDITVPLNSVAAGMRLKITNKNNHIIATIYNSSAHPDSWGLKKFQERVLNKEIKSIYNNLKTSGENLDLLIVRTDVNRPNLVISFRNNKDI